MNRTTTSKHIDYANSTYKQTIDFNTLFKKIGSNSRIEIEDKDYKKVFLY